jgi:hypothetical protein
VSGSEGQRGQLILECGVRDDFIVGSSRTYVETPRTSTSLLSMVVSNRLGYVGGKRDGIV